MDNRALFAPLSDSLRRKILKGEESLLKIQRETVWKKFKSQRFALLGLAFFFAIAFMAIVGPFLSSYAFDEPHLPLKNLPPSTQFWFGTDELGRDLFARCWWGARISLFVALAATMIDCVLGVLFGSIAAFRGGKTDEWMMRLADILHTIPYLLIVILLMVFLGSGIQSILISLTITGWITMARIVRSQILQIKQQDFVAASFSVGASKWHILVRHLIPNAMGSILVTMTFTIPSALFAEAFLSFLGLGIQSPLASLGTLANDGLMALRFYPWRLFIPAICICLTILSFNLIGDALRHALDERLAK